MVSKTVRHFAVISIVFFWGSNFDGGLCAQTEKEIRNKWQQNEQFIKSFSITWNEVKHITGDQVILDDGNFELPPNSTTMEHALSIFSDTRFRYGYKGGLPAIQDGKAALTYRDAVCVFDGKQAKGLSIDDYSRNKTGRIFQVNERFAFASKMSVLPTMFCFRMLNPKMRPIDTSLPFEVKNVKVNGKPRVKLTFVDADPRVQRELVLAPELDLSVVQYRLKVRKRIKTQFDLSYKLDSATNFWVPSGWTITRLANDGTIKTSTIATVEDCKVNPILPDSEFELEFPKDTVIFDRIENKTYVFRDDATKREVVSKELINQIPVKQLMETDPPDLLEARRRRRWDWVLWANIIVFVGLLFIAVKKMKKPN